MKKFCLFSILIIISSFLNCQSYKFYSLRREVYNKKDNYYIIFKDTTETTIDEYSSIACLRMENRQVVMNFLIKDFRLTDSEYYLYNPEDKSLVRVVLEFKGKRLFDIKVETKDFLNTYFY